MAKIPTIGATDPCIILMGTVVSCPAQVATEGQGKFISITLHLIQENLTRPCTKSSTAICRLSSSVAKLTTNYIGSILVPAMVAHCSPQTLILNFYSSPHMRLTTHQPNIWRESSELSKQLKWNMVVNPRTPHYAGHNRLRQALPFVLLLTSSAFKRLFIFKSDKSAAKLLKRMAKRSQI